MAVVTGSSDNVASVFDKMTAQGSSAGLIKQPGEVNLGQASARVARARADRMDPLSRASSMQRSRDVAGAYDEQRKWLKRATTYGTNPEPTTPTKPSGGGSAALQRARERSRKSDAPVQRRQSLCQILHRAKAG